MNGEPLLYVLENSINNKKTACVMFDTGGLLSYRAGF